VWGGGSEFFVVFPRALSVEVFVMGGGGGGPGGFGVLMGGGGVGFHNMG